VGSGQFKSVGGRLIAEQREEHRNLPHLL